jgi:hypothetical protein
MLWGLGVGNLISGMYFGWNLGLEKGGTLGLAIATFFCNMQHSHIAGNAGTLHRQNRFLIFICMSEIAFNLLSSILYCNHSGMEVFIGR